MSTSIFGSSSYARSAWLSLTLSSRAERVVRGSHERSRGICILFLTFRQGMVLAVP